jgi:ribonuclease HII
MTKPSFRFEKKLWRQYQFVAGVDEVGRGSFAGPVVAGCVVLPQYSTFNILNPAIKIDDSKRLSPRQREKSAKLIKENALAWGIGEAPASLINKVGMAQATKIAFRRAISDLRKRLSGTIDYLLADAFFIPFVPGLPTKRRKDKKGRFRKNPKGRQKAIIDGDQKSLTIAAASIIAKVHRDKLMVSLSKQSKYKKYGWGRNKGYGTKEHQRAIIKYGLTRYHRRVFVQTFLNSKHESRNPKQYLNSNF